MQNTITLQVRANGCHKLGFFDLDECYARLNERDPLVKLNRIIDLEAFEGSVGW